jgi:hypothetical protein
MVKLDDNEIEARAEALRLELKLQNAEKLNLIAVLDALKFSKFLKNYIVVPDKLLADAAARYNAEEKQIYISATTKSSIALRRSTSGLDCCSRDWTSCARPWHKRPEVIRYPAH